LTHKDIGRIEIPQCRKLPLYRWSCRGPASRAYLDPEHFKPAPRTPSTRRWYVGHAASWHGTSTSRL